VTPQLLLAVAVTAPRTEVRVQLPSTVAGVAVSLQERWWVSPAFAGEVDDVARVVAEHGVGVAARRGMVVLPVVEVGPGGVWVGGVEVDGIDALQGVLADVRSRTMAAGGPADLVLALDASTGAATVEAVLGAARQAGFSELLALSRATRGGGASGRLAEPVEPTQVVVGRSAEGAWARLVGAPERAVNSRKMLLGALFEATDETRVGCGVVVLEPSTTWDDVVEAAGSLRFMGAETAGVWGSVDLDGAVVAEAPVEVAPVQLSFGSQVVAAPLVLPRWTVRVGDGRPACASSGAPRTFPEATAPACAVEVLEVVEDARYRGQPDSPSRQAWLDTLDEQSLAWARAEDHGASHRLCTYRVRARGGLWAWTETWSTTLEPLPKDWCSRAIPEVVDHIRTVTRECTDPSAGAYWGSALEPLDQSARSYLKSADLALP